MRGQFKNGMAEATRLTREGRLDEATALIQNTLGGGRVSAPKDTGDFDEPMEKVFRLFDESPQDTKKSRCKTGRGAEARNTRTPKHTSRRTDQKAPRPPLIMPDTPPRDTDGEAIGSPSGGRFLERSYTGQAGTRGYKLYVPSGYTGQAVPLIVMLHGCTQNPDDFARGTGMNALAETHTFLVAYPAQPSNANMNKCWNWFQAADQQRDRGEPSIIAGITRQVLGEYNVSNGKVYVAGMSAGGAMAAILGETYPDLYAAVGVHSGLAPGAARDLPSAFSAMQKGGPATVQGDFLTGKTAPAIIFHGDRDTTVHPRNGEYLISYFSDVPGGPASPVTVSKNQTPGGHFYTRATHHDADGQVVAEKWTVNKLGHAWSGGSASGSYADPKGPDASAEMIRFFNQHPRTETSGI